MKRKDEGLRPEDLIGDPENPNSPAQMLEALINKAIDTGSMRPLGQARGGMQSQLDNIFGIFQNNLMRIGHATSVTSVQMDTMRMSFVALVDLLTEKGVFTKEEWETTYDEKVKKKMMERIELAKKQREEGAAAIKEAAATAEKPECKGECGGTCCEENTDVVLASERAGEVKHFPETAE
jgi:anionic cell wall polymer biosynthesis LytR-Cps2A-Psr (LCP) family protein